MRWVTGLLLLLLIAPAYSQQRMNGEEFSENLKSKCRLRFDREIVEKIESAGIVESKVEGRNYYSAEFTLKIREARKEVEARVNVYCSAQGNSPETPKSSATPRDQIEQEDSGGRYYRHVAWQRNTSGINWKGQVAHIDALHGDGTVLPMNFYLACLRVEGNVCLQIDVQPPRTATGKVHSVIMRMIGRIGYFD
ncbi:hypothetical protein [Variovorax sp. IB41]|uniref:hypothetical protein n=1 Tax=Variovorax sp. IB41 TaxID=2779370 RepID=UPI0018E8BBE6|nr:hypothetical protein [Variovorax sp. IB41]MBJ2157373.1 hypothetical protein [Variovorax sp. IB41]